MKRIIVCLAIILFLPVLAVAFQVELVAPVTDCYTGESLVIEIQVFPASPAQTTLFIENIPQALSLVSSQKEKRSKKDPSFFLEDRVESVVFIQEWLAETPGTYSLGPFVVTYKGVEEVLAPLEIRAHVRDTAGNGEIRWVLVASEPVRIGSEVSLRLEARYIYELISLDCPAPKNALLKNLSPTLPKTVDSVGAWEGIAAFLWTPLFSGEQVFPFARLEYRSRDGTTATAGTRRSTSTVLPAIHLESDTSVSALIVEAFSESALPVFDNETPILVVPAPDSLRESTAVQVASVVSSWDAGSYAESLAALRHLEHTAFFPKKYRSIRKDAESALGFAGTMPVPSLPRIQLVFIALAASVILLLIVLPFRKRSATCTTIFKVLVACVTVCFFICFVVCFTLFTYALKPAAVCKSGPLRQIPEQTAAVISTIPEGSLAVVLNQIASWCYIRLPSALEGWVEEDSLIIYTTAGFYGLW
ncbi:MAG TPA: hypothetical protein GXZ47_03405 [Treponema sp.]|nr:hypothetical protein [Treponema sp.]